MKCGLHFYTEWEQLLPSPLPSFQLQSQASMQPSTMISLESSPLELFSVLPFRLLLLLVLFLKPPLVHADGTDAELKENTLLTLYECSETGCVEHLIHHSLMAESAVSAGFLNTTYGNGSFKAYGLFLCRGDVPADLCRNCIVDAGSNLTKYFRRKKEAVMWFGHHLLRYNNSDSFGVPYFDFGFEGQPTNRTRNFDCGCGWTGFLGGDPG